METFLVGATLSILLVLACTAIFYEIMAHSFVLLERLKGKRTQILFTVITTFLAHTCAVWIFGTAYYLLDTQFQFGTLKGADSLDFFEYVYFSGVTYSSLGFGEVDPVGGLQLLAVVESIMGLVFIGWTVAFTYLVTDKYLTHRLEKHRKHKD